MPSDSRSPVADVSRRSLVGAGVGALGTLLAGGYAWTRYAGRHRVRFRPLEIVNESADPATVVLTVGTDLESAGEAAYRLAAAGTEGGDAATHAGGWIKHAREWTVQAEFEDQRVELGPAEIYDRLEGAGWGPDCARVTFVVTAERALESEVSPSDAC